MATVINNMYSPAMPALADFFGSTETMVQSGLMSGMLGLALGQLIFGPLSDKVGRRRPLLVSMSLFVVSTLCVLPVSDIRLFIALRFIQGFTAAGGIVISRSIATDLYRDRELLTAFAVINIVNGVAPIVTPLLSGSVVSWAGWHGVFVTMLVIGAILAVGCFMLKESLPTERRNNRSFFGTFSLFGSVLRNRNFLGMLLHQAAALALLFGNIASSAFIAKHYGMAPGTQGLALAINGIFIGIGAALAPKFGNAMSGVRVSCAGMLVMSAVVAVVLCFDWGFVAYEAAVCLMLASMGITLTSSTTLALESTRGQAGTASALFGAAGFLVGGLVAPLVSIGDMLFSTSAVFVVGAVLASLFTLISKPT